MRLSISRSLVIVSVAGGLATHAAAQLGNVYAIDLRASPNRLIVFPPNSPTLNVVSSTLAYDTFAMDFDASANTLYAITFHGDPPTQTPQIGTVNLTTGAFTPIAPISGAGASVANWGGLSFDPSTNTWYAMAPAAGLNDLYTIDVATGATNFVATMPHTGIFIDIAIDSNGNMFAHNISDDSLYSVDKATGAVTLLGPTGIAANFAQGMDFDFATNTLYATIYTGGGVGSYVSLNTTTGAATIILDTTPWNAEMEMAVRSPATTGGCYANCDQSTTPPILNVADFSCFLTKFASQDPYANCDQSTTPPVHNVADFTCFLTKFAGGC